MNLLSAGRASVKDRNRKVETERQRGGKDRKRKIEGEKETEGERKVAGKRVR